MILILSPLLLPPCLFGCSRPQAQAVEARQKSKPVAVETVEVIERDVPRTLLLAGSLKANQESDLAANASGLVLHTMVERGSFVTAGQTIAQLDVRVATLSTSEAQANVETARTQTALAAEECARYERLFQRGVITQQEHDRQTSSCKTATSSTAAAETRVEMARQTVANGTVRAPFPGLVSERYVSVGEYVMPSTRVAHVVDIDTLRLELTVPEQDMAAVKPGQKVDFEVSAFPNRSFTGVVHYIGPAVRATTRDLVFEATVVNKNKTLRPGLFATAHLDGGLQKLPVVPRSACKQDGDTVRTFAVVDDLPAAGTEAAAGAGEGAATGKGRHVEERIVQLGPVQGDLVAILKGLHAGERVAAHPSAQITDGVEVE